MTVQRFTIASDSTGTVAITQGGTLTVQPGNTANTTAWKVDGSAVTQPISGSTKLLDTGGSTAATVKAASTPAATTDTSLVVAQSPNANTLCTTKIPISVTASTDLITPTNKLHICAIILNSATAQSFSLVEGTGTLCGTGTAGMVGGTSPSMAVAANGGFAVVTDRAWLRTTTNANHLCLLLSSTGNVSGVITVTDQP